MLLSLLNLRPDACMFAAAPGDYNTRHCRQLCMQQLLQHVDL
jgi:hypothetical protein